MRRTPLARGAGLARGKPLERGKPLARGTAPLARSGPLKRVAGKPAKAPRKTGANPDVRALVIGRDQATCQRCGAPGNGLHHREGRGVGGRGKVDADRTNGPAWMVTLCGHGNTSGCHKEIDLDRASAEADGYVIRRNGPVVDASLMPVRTYRGWRYLTADGRSVPPPAVASAERVTR